MSFPCTYCIELAEIFFDLRIQLYIILTECSFGGIQVTYIQNLKFRQMSKMINKLFFCIIIEKSWEEKWIYWSFWSFGGIWDSEISAKSSILDLHHPEDGSWRWVHLHCGHCQRKSRSIPAQLSGVNKDLNIKSRDFYGKFTHYWFIVPT